MQISGTCFALSGYQPRLIQKRKAMTYPNDEDEWNFRSDSNGSNRNVRAKDRPYTGWIIGGLAALAVILAITFILPHRTDNTATNTRPAAPATTTGSGATSPAPAGPGTPATHAK
jgi:hypothetical protein